MHWNDFLDHVHRLAPGSACDRTTRLADLPLAHRLLVTRWLSDLFPRPTHLGVVGQFATLGAAWDWVEAEQRRGEVPRPVVPSGSTRVRLRPLADHDVVPLYEASLRPPLASRWRFRGRTLPLGEFAATIHDGVRTQFVVELAHEERAVGLVAAYDHDQTGLHAKLAFVRFGDRLPGDTGAVMEGMVVFIGHLFGSFPYRKLYAEVPSFNLGLFQPGFAECEAVLPEYVFHDGSFVDLHLVSISRDKWADLATATGW